MALLVIVALIAAAIFVSPANAAAGGPPKPPPKYKTVKQTQTLKKRTETRLERKMQRALSSVNDMVNQAKNPILANQPGTQKAIDTRARQYNTAVRNLNRVRNQNMRQYASRRNIWVEPTAAPPILPAPLTAPAPPLPSGSPTPAVNAAPATSAGLQPPAPKRLATRRDAGVFQRVGEGPSGG